MLSERPEGDQETGGESVRGAVRHLAIEPANGGGGELPDAEISVWLVDPSHRRPPPHLAPSVGRLDVPTDRSGQAAPPAAGRHRLEETKDIPFRLTAGRGSDSRTSALQAEVDLLPHVAKGCRTQAFVGPLKNSDHIALVELFDLSGFCPKQTFIDERRKQRLLTSLSCLFLFVGLLFADLSSVDTSNPAIKRHLKTGHHEHTAEAREIYASGPSVRKSGCTLVRQLRGPHLRTWA